MEAIIEQILSHKLSLFALVVFAFTARYTVAYWRVRARSKVTKAEVDLVEDLKKDIQNLTTDYLRELETVRKLSVQMRDFDMVVQERNDLLVVVADLKADNRMLRDVIEECDRCKHRLQERIIQLKKLEDKIEDHQKRKRV